MHPSCSRTSGPDTFHGSSMDHRHGFRQQHRPWTQTWPLVAAQTRTPPESELRLPAVHISCFLLSLTLQFCAPHFILSTCFCFSFFPFLHHLLVLFSDAQGLSVWDCLKSGLGSAMPHLCIMSLGRDHLRHGLLSPYPGLHGAGLVVISS